jgi:hypothetical protein
MKVVKSFYAWCIENNREDLLDRFDYELNNVDPSFISYGSNTGYYFKCPRGIHESENIIINKITLSNSPRDFCSKCRSFYQWCIDHNRNDLLVRWDYNKNKCTPWDIKYATNKKYYFKCPRNIHPSELKQISKITTRNTPLDKCNMCGSIAQWGIDNLGDDFLTKYWSEKNGNIDPWFVRYGEKKSYWIQCQEKSYHVYKIPLCNFVRGVRCNYCNSRGFTVHPFDSLGAKYPEVSELWSEKNLHTPFEFTFKSKEQVYWKCEAGKHKDYYREIANSTKYEFRCPECSYERNISFLQEKVSNYILDNYNYTLLHEHHCTLVPKNPKDNSKNNTLPFDNEVIINDKHHLIIEVMGTQHYFLSDYTGGWGNKYLTPEQQLHKRKLYDRYKKYIAWVNKYEYLEIPHWTERDESYKTLIDNKIAEILSKQKSA